MLVVIIVLLLVSSFIGGVFLFMKNRGGQEEEVGNTGEIIVTSSDTKSSSAQETDKQDNESSTKKTSTKILEIGYPKARYVKVSKNALIEKWEERPIILNEVYVYGKDGKNIALKKPIATNSSGRGTLSAFNDGDEMTLGNTVSGDKNNNQPQRQNIEIDLGSMQEIQSVVLLMKGIDKGLLVTLFDDKLNVVSMTRELTIEDTNKGSKHKFDFGTSKWSVLPVDCVGKWGEWSPCSAGCGDGTQKRDWITLRKAENGGKACVYDLNKDGFKTCKGVCNVEICYSCGFGNCKVFKNGTYPIHSFPNDAISSIKIPTGRKVEAWYHAINYYGGGSKLNLTKNTDLCRENTNFNNQISHLRIS